jgi:hypothetical protein
VVVRFEDERKIYDFGWDFLVRCPKCQNCAHVVHRGEVLPPSATARNIGAAIFKPMRLVCSTCGYIKDTAEKVKGVRGLGEGPFDWYFHLPLWLQTPSCGQTLWAYNVEHLEFLESYVRADIRVDGLLRRLTSRLPTWIKLAKNREENLHGCAKLGASLPDREQSGSL